MNNNSIKETEIKKEEITNIEDEKRELISNKEILPDLFEKKLPPPKPVPNFDEIPIKSGNSNFMDLLEKHKKKKKNQPQPVSQKPIRKYTPNIKEMT